MSEQGDAARAEMLAMIEAHLRQEIPYKTFDKVFYGAWCRFGNFWNEDDPDWILIGEIADELTYTTERPIDIERKDGIRDPVQFHERARRACAERFGEDPIKET